MSLNFWSHRRAKVVAEARAHEQTELDKQTSRENEDREEASDEAVLTELNLQVPEDMRLGDDFSSFMQNAVPEHLRRRALRVLWRSNPVLANLDSLVDYGEDFTDCVTVHDNMQTAYQVGKGMLAQVVKMAEAREPETLADRQIEKGRSEGVPPVEERNLALTEGVDSPLPVEVMFEDEPLYAPLPKRRMRFEFLEC